MAKTTKPKVKRKILDQISFAVCILFLAHTIIKEVGKIWGFAEIADQIAGTFVAFAAPIEAVFLGKRWGEKDKEVDNENQA